MTFKDEHPEMQQLVRELLLLRQQNLTFRPGDSQETLLLFAEAAVCVVAFERFIRIVLGVDVAGYRTLRPLLQEATGGDSPRLRLPYDDREDAIRRICDVRNTLLHGNYEQAAKQAGCSSVAEYFSTKFASEIERFSEILLFLVQQIDLSTGATSDQASSARTKQSNP